MSKGKINVKTENIFPIIKKFLYSDHEIFLRELVSNAIDATQKLNKLSSIGEIKGTLKDLTIEVELDEKKKTLTVRDKGIGMTDKEVEKYINQIAFSSAEDFVKKFKDKGDKSDIIGQFGLGFYSSFMVSDKVEIITKSYQKNAKPVHWECDGSPEYNLKEGEKKERGTEIILHINEESKDFLEKYKIKDLLKKYCKFLPFEIKFDGEIINNTEPAWTKKPTGLKTEDYEKFYSELYPTVFDKPLFNIHLNVDYPFNLTGILYFPKLKDTFEIQKNKIQLYSRQVFVTDSVEGIVPDFLMLLHGVLDSPDIPLNVSRSYLQSDPNVKKISSHITKKVADKLEELFKKDRKDFESKWDDIKIFIQYGMMMDDKFYDKAQKFCLLKSTEGKYYTLEEYSTLIKDKQTDKDKKVVYLYATNNDEQHSYIQAARSKEYDVLDMNHYADSHFINLLETKLDNATFVRVDSDTIGNLVKKVDKLDSKLTEDQQKVLTPLIEKQVDKTKFTVKYEDLSKEDQPFLITQPEFSRRMKDMAAISGGADYMNSMPDQYNLVVNANHPLVTKILLEPDKKNQTKLVKQAADLAMLSQNLLKGEDLTKFIKRTVELID